MFFLLEKIQKYLGFCSVKSPCTFSHQVDKSPSSGDRDHYATDLIGRPSW